MKKNKGFTLVELLAVIAILSLLVIIALPNIMSLFNEAKKNSFLSECKQIHKTAQNQWMTDSLINTDNQIYSRCDTCTGKQLKLSGRTQLQYYVKVNKGGKVVQLYVTDGTYQYEYEGQDLKIEDITDAQRVAELNTNEIIHINPDGMEQGEATYVYFTYGGSYQVGEAAPILDPESCVFDNYRDAMNCKELPYFIRVKVVDGKVAENAIGWEYNNNIYYLKREMSNQEKQNIMLSSFESQYCNFSNPNDLRCEVPGGLEVWSGYGSIEIYYGDIYWFCGIQESWGSLCTQP